MALHDCLSSLLSSIVRRDRTRAPLLLRFSLPQTPCPVLSVRFLQQAACSIPASDARSLIHPHPLALFTSPSLSLLCTPLILLTSLLSTRVCVYVCVRDEVYARLVQSSPVCSSIASHQENTRDTEHGERRRLWATHMC